MVTTMKKRVLRSAIFGTVASIVILALLELVEYTIVNLISQIPVLQQLPFLYWIGGFSIFFAFIFGMVVNNIAVRNWDTWLDDLGPTQIAVLIEMMKVRKSQLEGNGK